MNFRRKFFKVALLILLIIPALGWVVMALWNWLMPNLFIGVQQIDLLQAIGLLILSRILFGGFRGRCGWHGEHHRARWEQMSEEEREKFKEGMRMFRGRGKP